MRIFLGGTCNNSIWRNELIEKLERNVDYYNPVVSNWTKECQEKELFERKHCDYCLYVITSEMIGVYSIAEVVDDSNKRPDKVIFAVLENGFSEEQIKSLKMVSKMVKNNGSIIFNTLDDIAYFFKHKSKEES